MEFRHLRHLDSLASAGSMHKAARELGLRQPALSQSIRALEADVGVQLVARSSSGTHLTSAGTAFLNEVRYAFAILDRAVMIAKTVDRTKVRPMRLGVSMEFAVSGLTKTIQAYMSYPDNDVIVTTGASSKLLSMIDNGLLDVYIFSARGSERHGGVELLWKEEIHVVLSNSHPLSVEDVIDIRCFIHGNLVVYATDGDRFAEVLLDACRAIDSEACVPVTFCGGEARLALVAAGIGVAVGPSSAILAVAGLITRPLAPRLTMEISAVWPTTGLTEQARCFVEIARSLKPEARGK